MKIFFTFMLFLSISLPGCAGKDNWLSSDSFIMNQPEYQRAVAGDPEAQFRVGAYYLNFNDFSNHSRRQGIIWMKKSADQRYPKAVELVNSPAFKLLELKVATE